MATRHNKKYTGRLPLYILGSKVWYYCERIWLPMVVIDYKGSVIVGPEKGSPKEYSYKYLCRLDTTHAGYKDKKVKETVWVEPELLLSRYIFADPEFTQALMAELSLS